MASTAVYETSHIKSPRRTKGEMARFHAALLDVVSDQWPMTVRQVFYQAEVRGLVEKEESGYTKVQRALMHLRSVKRLSFSWIVDSTRWQRKPSTHDSAEDAIRAAASSYRQAVWSRLDQRLEIWCEKDALAGVLVPVTAEFDVPLLVARGYSSASFVHSAAMEIADDAEYGITTYVYHLGDYDPSGQDAARDIKEKLLKYTPPDSFGFKQLAVTMEQINSHHLPTRPTKRKDTRARGFGDVSVELDALPPDVLRGLVRSAIEAHLPDGHMDNIRFAEAEERRGFTRMMDIIKDRG